MSTLSCN